MNNMSPPDQSKSFCLSEIGLAAGDDESDSQTLNIKTDSQQGTVKKTAHYLDVKKIRAQIGGSSTGYHTRSHSRIPSVPVNVVEEEKEPDFQSIDEIRYESAAIKHDAGAGCFDFIRHGGIDLS
jgi:hypothetical protein